MVNHFKPTTAIHKLNHLEKRLKVVQGGTYAGKTLSVIIILIDRLTAKVGRYKDTLVVAETIPAIKAGALKIFKDVMQSTNRWRDEHYNATDRIYTFHDDNGKEVSKIQFTAFDSVGKAKVAGKHKELFVNECNYVPFNIAWELIIRTEGDVWFDYNPDAPFWIQDEIRSLDHDFIILTYEDNEATPAQKIEEFNQARKKAETSQYWKNWCRVYLDGEMGRAEGLIFQDWTIIDTIPDNAKFIGHGLDFGYTNNPSSWVSCYEVDDTPIFDEEFYEYALRNNQIANKIREGQKGWTIADSAEPKSIDEIYDHGVKIRGATKGPDSVRNSIDLIQQRSFLVTSRSLNLIKELRRYKWKEDKSGNFLEEPSDEFDHAISAMRYIALEFFTRRVRVPRRNRVTIARYS